MTQERFEKDYQDDDDCYSEGYVDETCPYFDKDNKDLFEVTLNGEEVFETKDIRKTFKKVEGNNYDFIPSAPDKEDEVNIWWCHDMKFREEYLWENVTDFDPEKVTIHIGKDQEGREFLDGILYNGEEPDEVDDIGDTGWGFHGVEFVYHPNQKFASMEDEAG